MVDFGKSVTLMAILIKFDEETKIGIHLKQRMFALTHYLKAG